MPRSLVRFVFPRFLVRMVLLVLALTAAMLFVSGRANLQSQMRSDLTNLRIVALLVEERSAREDTGSILSELAEQFGREFHLVAADGRVLGANGPPSARSSRYVVIGPGAQTLPISTERFAVPVSIPELPAAAALGTRVDPGMASYPLPILGWVTAIALFAIAATAMLARRLIGEISRPLSHLQVAAGRFADGDLAYRSLLPEPQEFARLAATMNGMAEQIRVRIEALRNQREQLEAILRSMVEGVVLVDENMRIRSLNPAAETLFAIQRRDWDGQASRHLLEAIRNSDVYEIAAETLETATESERTIVVYTKPARYMQVHGTIVNVSGERAVLLVFNDVTRLYELEQIRRDFVSNVSHELKTPITSIQGFVETLIDGAIEDPPEARRFLEIVHRHTQRMVAIIEDLLQLSRLERDRETVTAGAVPIAGIIDAAIEEVRGHAESREIRIVSTVEPALIVWAHGNLLHQAIVNLLDNAIKYGPGSSVVTVAATEQNSGIDITVRDAGGAIDREELPRLFERFYRTDRARSRALGGTGLGLAIVKHIAQAHQGSVSVTSSPSSGTTFAVHLPSPTDQTRARRPATEFATPR